MLRIPWTTRRTNESILNEINIKKRLSSTCLASILSFFGYIARREDNLERLVVSRNVEGWRSRGRSPTRWTDQIQKAIGDTFCASLTKVRETMEGLDGTDC